MRSSIKYLATGALGLASLAILASALPSNAFWGGRASGQAANQSATRPCLARNSANFEQMKKAFETNDYNLWKSLVGDRPMTQYINQDNFARFAEMHRLMLEGKYEDAAKIREELNLPGQGRGMMGGGGMRGGMWRNSQ